MFKKICNDQKRPFAMDFSLTLWKTLSKILKSYQLYVGCLAIQIPLHLLYLVYLFIGQINFNSHRKLNRLKLRRGRAHFEITKSRAIIINQSLFEKNCWPFIISKQTIKVHNGPWKLKVQKFILKPNWWKGKTKHLMQTSSLFLKIH